MSPFVALKSHPKPLPRRVTLLLPQEGFRFMETWDSKDSFFYNDRFTDPAFDRLDVDAPAQSIEAAAAMELQTKHATAARHSHHFHARR